MVFGHGGHGSGGASEVGNPALLDLLGGSSGGSSIRDGSGAGGGAIQLKAFGMLKIEPKRHPFRKRWQWGKVIRFRSSEVLFVWTLNRSRTLVKLKPRRVKESSCPAPGQTRGSAGGRVALYAQAEVYLGDVNVDGEWLSNPGSIFIEGNYFSSSIDIDQGTLIFDTKSGSFW